MGPHRTRLVGKLQIWLHGLCDRFVLFVASLLEIMNEFLKIKFWRRVGHGLGNK